MRRAIDTHAGIPAPSMPHNPRMRLGLAGFFASALAVAAYLFALAPSAIALEEPGWKVFEMKPSTTQAGGHPDIEIDFEFNTDDEFGCEGPGPQCLVARQFAFHWPEGFIGNPHVALKCSLAEFSTPECPADAQIGLGLPRWAVDLGPLYNMETNPDQAGLPRHRAVIRYADLHRALRPDRQRLRPRRGQPPQFRFGVPAVPYHPLGRAGVRNARPRTVRLARSQTPASASKTRERAARE